MTERSTLFAAFPRILLPTVLAVSSAVDAAPTSVISHISADNHYALYVGNASASSLRFIGRNEIGALGSSGGWNWSAAETWTFAANAGEYLYLVAWDDEDQQMWIGDFAFGAFKLVSDVASWLYVVPEALPKWNRNADVPVETSVLREVVTEGAWKNPAEQFSNGTGPWLTIAGIDPAAQFIWHDTLYGPSSSEGRFVVFRSADPLPVPSSLGLLTTAVIGFAVRRRELKRSDSPILDARRCGASGS